MSSPTHCAACGHELGIGRFCTNCGQPVPGRHPEAAPLLSAPVTPPPSADLPPAARFPLFAESPETESHQAAPAAPVAPPAPASAAAVVPDTAVAPQATQPPDAVRSAPLPLEAAPAADRERSGPGTWLLWMVGLAVIALVGAVGAMLVLGGDDGEGRAADSSSEAVDAPDPSTRPDSDGTGAPVAEPNADDVADLRREATPRVPAEAPPSTDRQGQRVTFVAENMLDARPRTAWRMPGDGTGETLTFDLGADAVLTEVGLINGYAKVDGADNWYLGNRRIRVVQWEFDDGTRITQDLTDRRTLQRLAIDPVETRTVRLHLVEVTAPGQGASSRDFTAVSEVLLRGAIG